LVYTPLERQKQEDQKFKASPDKVIKTLSQKQNVNKRAGVHGSSGNMLA
jgi:hypothetical protein